jgi:hypothetical protein
LVISLVLNIIQLVSLFLLTGLYLPINICYTVVSRRLCHQNPRTAMRFGSLAGLASAGLAGIVAAQDLLFYSTMVDTQEYIRATTVLGLTGRYRPGQ